MWPLSTNEYWSQNLDYFDPSKNPLITLELVLSIKISYVYEMYKISLFAWYTANELQTPKNSLYKQLLTRQSVRSLILDRHSTGDGWLKHWLLEYPSKLLEI